MGKDVEGNASLEEEEKPQSKEIYKEKWDTSL
jgi:hypothetical protein